MKISLTNPPIYEKAMELFKPDAERIIFFTYGDTLYSPMKKMPPDDLLVHEAVHADQQGHSDEGAKEWWDRYFVDAEWRIEQEAEAYAEQYKWLLANNRKRGNDRNFQHRVLMEIARLLSSEVYGRAISTSDAMVKIRAYADGSAIKDIEDHMPDGGEV